MVDGDTHTEGGGDASEEVVLIIDFTTFIDSIKIEGGVTSDFEATMNEDINKSLQGSDHSQSRPSNPFLHVD